jgi:hypothetical protein
VFYVENSASRPEWACYVVFMENILIRRGSVVLARACIYHLTSRLIISANGYRQMFTPSKFNTYKNTK